MAERQRFAVFRADASAEIGLGHAMRCAVLAEVLREEGWACRFAATAGSTAVLDGLANLPVLTLAASEVRDPGALRRLSPEGCDLFVADHYELDADYEQPLRGWAQRILVIDDLADRPHDCDCLLDQTHDRAASDYHSLVPARCDLLTGAAYALLRPEFVSLRMRAWNRHRAGGEVRRIVVSFGATDPTNATCAALDAIAVAAPHAAVDIALGAAAKHLSVVRKRAAAMPLARLHVQTAHMAELMCDADLAVAAPSSASWERCCLSLPTIMVVTAENQSPTAAALKRAGAARLASLDGLGTVLMELIAAPQARAEMARQAARICDGLGARRVLAALAPAQAHDGRAVALRPAVMADADRILDWQRHPSIRAHSRNPKVPERDEHREWMSRKLDDPACLLTIIEHAGQPAGVLRLDAPRTNGHREVSIFVDVARQRLGIAKAALAQLRRLLPAAAFEAVVLQGNEASAELFITAGYRHISDGVYVAAPDQVSASCYKSASTTV